MSEKLIKYGGKFMTADEFAKAVAPSPRIKGVGKRVRNDWLPILKLLSEKGALKRCDLEKTLKASSSVTKIGSIHSLKRNGYLVNVKRRWGITEKGEKYLHDVLRKLDEAGKPQGRKQAKLKPKPEPITTPTEQASPKPTEPAIVPSETKKPEEKDPLFG